MKIKNILYDVAGVLLSNYPFQLFAACAAAVIFGVPVVWAFAWIFHYVAVFANLLPWPT